MGLDRIAMVRHGVPDLRLLFEGDKVVYKGTYAKAKAPLFE